MTIRFKAALAALLAIVVPCLASAQQCGDGAAGFPAWLEGFKQEAAAAGISAGALAALDGVGYDQKRRQRRPAARRLLAKFPGIRRPHGRELPHGPGPPAPEETRRHLRPDRARLRRARARSSSPSGGWRPISAPISATSARCSRSPRSPMIAAGRTCSAPSCLAALMMLDRGDLTPQDMVGAWAGEIGQMQFIPTYYFDSAVDYDGDGRRNLVQQRAGRARLLGQPPRHTMAGRPGSLGCRKCASRPSCPGPRPTSPSACRARNGPAGA